MKNKTPSTRLAGMTIIETMLAGVILAGIIGVLLATFKQIKKRQNYVVTQQTQVWAVNHLVEQVKAMAAGKANTNLEEEASTMQSALASFQEMVQGDSIGHMPVVWSYGQIESSQDSAEANLALCPLCKGRLGYRVVPLHNFPGYVLTIALSHPDIFQQHEEGDQKVDNIVYKQFVLGSN